MRSTMKYLLISLLLLLCLAGCGAPDQDDEQGKHTEAPSNVLSLSDQEMREAGITLETVTLQTIHKNITLTGSVAPNQTKLAKVLPALPGRVAAVFVQLGDSVSEGQPLADLNSIELGEARMAYRQAKSAATLAGEALKRAGQLVKDEVIPKKDYLAAKADAQSAQAALDAASNKLQLLQVSPEAEPSKTANNRYPLVSPFAGTVIEQDAVMGEQVLADQPLMTVADLTDVWVEVDVYEKDLADVNTGSVAQVHVDAYPGKVFEGKLTYLGNTMDAATRTVKARIVVSNPTHQLKVGMFVTVNIPSTRSDTQALIIPTSSVTLIQGQRVVFTHDDNGFDVRPIDATDVGNDQVRVTQGLKPGDQIVSAGVYELKARLLKSQIGSDD